MDANLHRFQTVTRGFWSCICILVLVSAMGALQQARADVGDRIRLGQAGEWRDTIAGATLNNRLYTVEKSGTLYVTDLSTGRWSQVGKAEFGNTRMMFAVGPSLYTIETDGSLYQVSPSNGAWARVGKAGEWKETITGVGMSGRLYTVEASGGLYETNPATGVWKQIGKAEFGNTRRMIGANGALYTLEADGSLYRVNPANGSWSQVGKAGDWKGTIAGAALNGRLYTVETGGTLYESQLEDGHWITVGKPVFGKTVYMFESGSNLYTLDADGSLYRVEMPPLAG